jgi:hypothetical protein
MVLPRQLVTDPLTVILYTVTQGLLLWAGEWFLDTSEGFPWTVILGQKVVNTAQFVAVMKAYLLSCTGIVAADVTATFNGPQRSFAYSFTATTSTGAVLVGGTNQPFQYAGPN